MFKPLEEKTQEITFTLPFMEESILKSLRQLRRPATIDEIATGCSQPKRTVQRYLAKLKNRKIVQPIGKGKATRWVLCVENL